MKGKKGYERPEMVERICLRVRYPLESCFEKKCTGLIFKGQEPVCEDFIDMYKWHKLMGNIGAGPKKAQPHIQGKEKPG